jgi:hypothetical protein
MPKPQMAFSGTFPSALVQVDRLPPTGYPTPELLQKYRYLSCTFVILTTRATGLRLSRARRGGCPRPSDDAVERSLTSRKSVVGCQLAKLRRLRDVESWRRGSKRLASWPVRRYAKRYYFATTSSQLSSRMGRILRRNSLRINILTSNSFGWNILRGNTFSSSLFSIFCMVWGRGGSTKHFHRFVPKWQGSKMQEKIGCLVNSRWQPGTWPQRSGLAGNSLFIRFYELFGCIIHRRYPCASHRENPITSRRLPH